MPAEGVWNILSDAYTKSEYIIMYWEGNIKEKWDRNQVALEYVELDQPVV